MLITCCRQRGCQCFGQVLVVSVLVVQVGLAGLLDLVLIEDGLEEARLGQVVAILEEDRLELLVEALDNLDDQVEDLSACLSF